MLANPWVLRIGGGLLSGLIVYLVSSLLVAKKEKKYYLRKLYAANLEILQTIRPMIAKDDLFDINLFNSIISSTANKYNVDKADLYNIQSLIDDIITDIMQSPFLTMEQKDLYCKNLMDLKVKSSKKAALDSEQPVLIREGVPVEYMSLLMALMTIIFAILSIYIFQLNDIEKAMLFSNKLYLLLLLIVLPLIPLFFVQIMDNIKKMRSRSKAANLNEKIEEKAADKKETESKEMTPEN